MVKNSPQAGDLHGRGEVGVVRDSLAHGAWRMARREKSMGNHRFHGDFMVIYSGLS